jgi:hypothetical protein
MQQTIYEDPTPPSKRRHGCFTTWLIVVSILNTLVLYGVLHAGKDNKAWPQLEYTVTQ